MSENADDQFGEGDEFALSPRGASRIISSILAAGGEFELDGNVVRITSLPAKSVGIKMKPPVASPPEPAVEVEPEAAVEVEAPAPVVESPAPEKAPKAAPRRPAAEEKK